jgi:hypothetical protein
MDSLARLYPQTFRMLLLAAREALRPKGAEVRLEGRSADPSPRAGTPERAADGAGVCRHHQSHSHQSCITQDQLRS